MNHSPDYDNFIKRGYRYYIDECREKLAAHKINDVYDMEQEIAWQSMIIVMESIINLAHRYADLAEQKAIECKDARRKEELLTMAEKLPHGSGKSSADLSAGNTACMVPSSCHYFRGYQAETITWADMTSICSRSLKRKQLRERRKNFLPTSSMSSS